MRSFFAIVFYFLFLVYCSPQKGQNENEQVFSEDQPKQNVADLVAKAKNYNKVGVALLKKEPEKALQAFRKAMQIDPRIPDYPNNAGVALLQQKKFQEAIPYFQKSVVLQKKYARGHYNLGVAYQNAKLYHKAIPSYHKAIQLSPKSSEIYFNLAISYEKSGDKRQALRFYRKFVATASPRRANIIQDAKKKIEELKKKS
ncbi:MAG: tetratricopeptide repeat protein [Spirochaetota bacterium]